MKKTLTSFLIAITLGFLDFAGATLSARRPVSMSYQPFLRSAQHSSNAKEHYQGQLPAVIEKRSFDQAEWNRVPQIKAADLQDSFEAARNEFVFDDPDLKRLSRRRATWLYPDDGCFVRAVIATDMIEKRLSVKSAKIFAFGDLVVKTVNSPAGEVGWWYHVAAILKVPDGRGEKFFVVDPAIDSKAAMEVHAWLKAMNAPNAEIAICSGDAYDPDSACASGQPDTYSRAKSEAIGYLNMEWDQLESLKREPRSELGDHPPWL